MSSYMYIVGAGSHSHLSVVGMRWRGLESYKYTKDLLEMDSRKSGVSLSGIPCELQGIQTPLQADVWEEYLRTHPDKDFCEYLLSGIRRGFRLGFDYCRSSCVKAKSNMKSALENATVVDEYIAEEVKLGRVLGPVKPESLPPVQVNRIGVIPKSHQPDRWRLIVDLSHPAGSSVNDGIDPELCTLRYTSVDEAIRRVLQEGRATELAKLDLQSAYRMVPVDPVDRLLLGMVWRDELYVDAALPFGLRSAPKIFNAIADALQWIMEARGSKVIHYLDDFLLFGAPGSKECLRSRMAIERLCAELGVPIASHKTEGPSCQLTFLGIELDSKALIARLPEDKLHRLQMEIRRWEDKSSCTKRELLSLVSQLQRACCVVRPGRTFLRRMISLSKVAKELHHHVRLNRGFKSDLQWWASFLPVWNGSSMMGGVHQYRYSATVTSDASGRWGCGAYSSSGDWFQLEWPEEWREVHITVKELLPVVVAVAMWGKQWQGRNIRCRCDNAAVVAILNTGSSKEERAMHLMRSLFFVQAMFDISLFGEHIPGAENGPADALSRGDARSFLSQVRSARHEPTVVRVDLRQALLLKRPDWTSKSWRDLLKSFLHEA